MDAKIKNYLTREGFNVETGYTYVYAKPDSYQIKEYLKDAGFHFNKELLWHTSDENNAYAESCIPVHYTTVLELYAWGSGAYYPTAAQTIRNKISALNPIEECGGYITPDNDNKVRVVAKCTSIKEVEGNYGPITLFEFTTDEGDVLNWWTKSEPDIEIGDVGAITATFKKNSEFRGKKATTVSRLKFTEEEV